jgi:hypothetical protein
VSVKTKKLPASERLIRDAAKVMGRDDGFIGSTDRFICDAIRWLRKKCEDLHIQTMIHDGWQVSTCQDTLGWQGWIHGRSLQDALAKAVMAQKRNTEYGPRQARR